MSEKKQRENSAKAFPRHSIEKALRIPKGILEQNAGKECSDEESAKFLGIKYNKGNYATEIASSIKYGFLERPSTGKIVISELARKILKPTDPHEKTQALQAAALNAPLISDVYSHYRGENLPDDEFFKNALTEQFKIQSSKANEFKQIFIESLKTANLIEENDDKIRIIDVSDEPAVKTKSEETFKKLEKTAKIKQGDSCFIMMPFAEPLGSYFDKIYKPAVEKAGFLPVRADDDIFGTGKITDQIWTGINNAKVLIAELTNRNPNVFYELGLAHALEKPVVLVSSNQSDVPFDLRHIRVIYYDVTDPFWGTKLIDKIAENLLSAIKHPEEAIFKRKP